MSTINLVGLLPEDLEPYCNQMGEPLFRAKQIFDWVYRKKTASFEEMTNLSGAFRRALAYRFSIGSSRIVQVHNSRDGSRKYLIELEDGETVECVMLPARGRSTGCISVQVGCPVQCPFCATGLSGYTRNLNSSEMVEQLWLTERQAGSRITHLVFMGMGEPLLNYDELSKALRVIHSSDGLAIGSRHITVSTIGIPDTMLSLAHDWDQVNLALSLHAPNDHLRNILVPINRVYPIQPVMKALKTHIKTTGRRVTIEYSLWQEVNDLLVHARQLADLLPESHVHVNLIQGNQVTGANFIPSSLGRTRVFAQVLADRGIPVTIRETRGADIQAACGELRSACQGEPIRCNETKPVGTTHSPAEKKTRGTTSTPRRRQR